MNFRSDSLHDRLTLAQRHDLMIKITEAGQSGETDRFDAGLAFCVKLGVKTSRTAVYDFFKRYNFGWRLELGAWASQHTENMPDFDKEARILTKQKLFAELTDADCPVKFQIMIRSLQIEQDKLDLAKSSAETRFKMESGKLKLAERRVSLLEKKMEKATAKLNELRDPKNADNAKSRKAILDEVDAIMGIKKK